MRAIDMSYRALADAVVVLHFAVVIFVVLGALLVLRWRWTAWIHLPTVAWVIYAELFHRVCPLTYLENWLRRRGAGETYRGDFISHYIFPMLYPDNISDRAQLVLGTLIAVINVTLYVIAFGCRRRSQEPALKAIDIA